MLYYYNNMKYNIVDSKPNFLIIAIASMLGLLVIIIGYYIFASRDPESRSKLYKNDNDFNASNNNDNNNSSNNNNYDDDETPRQVTDILGEKSPIYKPKTDPLEPQVFNVSENLYNYKDAEAVCKVFNSELATIEQLVDAYTKGADWCNYGWLKGGLAYYPTQQSTWEKLQKNDPHKRNVCGDPGLNGGDFSDNPNMLFGVNCYGVKPQPRAGEKLKQTVLSDADMRTAQKVAELKRHKDRITILPFSEDKWSGCDI